jgi:hypothetical protein
LGTNLSEQESVSNQSEIQSESLELEYSASSKSSARSASTSFNSVSSSERSRPSCPEPEKFPMPIQTPLSCRHVVHKKQDFLEVQTYFCAFLNRQQDYINYHFDKL